MHESPVQWFGSILFIAKYLQTTLGGSDDLDEWKVGFNSSFLVQNVEGRPLRVVSPDLFLADDQQRLSVVLEVANTQTMKNVLNKARDVWMRAPNIAAVIVIKLEEVNAPSKTTKKNWKPNMPFLSFEEWMSRNWLGGEIKYDGVPWIGNYYARFLIFIKTTPGVLNESVYFIHSGCSWLFFLTGFLTGISPTINPRKLYWPPRWWRR
jgi:hypothetical protein